MRSMLLAAFILTFALVATPAVGRETVPIINFDNIAIATSSGSAPGSEQVKQAIMKAGGARGWSIAHQAEGKLLATLIVRNKHTIAVEIGYSAEKYSLMYANSSNMKYGQRDGQPVIHPYYNKWVQELKEAIRLELLKI
jgi:hypothetical protein